MVAMKEIVVVLCNIRSVHNVGSIFRTADAAGISKIYLCGITPTPIDRFGRPRSDFTKVSLGAERSVPWEYARAAAPLLKRLRREGYRIFTVEQSPGAVPYDKKPKTKDRKPIALVMGNEVRGLPPSIIKLADKVLEIPMRGALVRHARHPRHTGRGKESLNVAVAFGIVAYHFLGHPSHMLRNGFGKTLMRNTGAKGIPKL